MGARRFGEPCELLRQLVDRARIAVADDRHDEALVRLDGDAEVVPVEVDDLVLFQARVQFRHLLQGLGHGLERQRDEPLEVDCAEVALFDPGHRRYLGVRAGHVFGDQLPDAT